MVPQPHEQAGRRETPGPGWRLPGPGEHYQPRTVCANRHALWPAQTPTAGGPRGSGESGTKQEQLTKSLSKFTPVSYKVNEGKIAVSYCKGVFFNLQII